MSLQSGLVWGVVAVGMGLSACSSTPEAEAPAVVAVAIAEATEPVGSRMPDADADLCRAAEHRHLIGKPKSEIPVPVEVINRRVVCTTCPVTEDFSAYRLNIFFNAETELVEQVRCG